MKHQRSIFMALLLGLLTHSIQANNRFYPANSIRCTNVLEQETDEYDPINRKYKKRLIYYHYYTGNDTIIDGSPCVMLWKYCEDNPKEKELRFIREVEGIVSLKYPLTEGGYSDWIITFEFPYGGWVKGEKYIDGLIDGEPAIFPAYPTTYTLLNGEEIQLNFNTLMYGIGYNDWPFLEVRNFGETAGMRPYNYYRNDTLLWGEQTLKRERFFPAYGIRCTNMVTSMFNNDTTYYNLYTGGDTIVDGKECVQLWEYRTDTPENLKQYLLYEEAGKVYIQYANYEDDGWQLLYDFSLPKWHVGDSIEYEAMNLNDFESPNLMVSNERFVIESIDTFTLLNGKIRQVANCYNGSLIHGIGNVGEPFFSPINRLVPPNGEVCQPVSFYCYDQLLWGKELPKKREQRFFPANGIYSTVQCISPIYDEDCKEVEHRDTVYYNVWTGNDTIVDGRECVAAWHNNRGETVLKGVVHEDNTGLVYINHLEEGASEWELLYDFTPRKWKDGDMIHTDAHYDRAFAVSSVTLCNGKRVPYVYLSGEYVYSIGYLGAPALTRDMQYGGHSWSYNLFNFYRNGVLLWGEEYNPNTSVTLPQTKRIVTPYYDLQGRPVANPTRGIYIKDGKKVVIK